MNTFEGVEGMRSAGTKRKTGDQMTAVSIEGTTRWSRSERDTCICCEGPHVFGYTLDLPRWADRDYNLDAAYWLHTAVRRMPEGARVRVTVEVVPPVSSVLPVGGLEQ